MKEYKYKINGNMYKVSVGDIEHNVAEVEVNGVPYKVELNADKKPVTIKNAPRPSAAPRTAEGGKVIAKPASAGGAGHKVVSPLPGTIVSVNVKVGDTVGASDTVAILEAMKMENAIHAGRDGVVKSIEVNPGDAVLEGAPILTIE
ncbi:MAG: acetyl-CoA carboxylase biotin carboxyl carrier protein subunit [Paramuribaculum sp.]|nr:acetyl-CoA carboxylase biotin carboxyl carrier protein subunit [Paramuribaculum sp.]MDE6324167.1 acetyl-CoA carboxylase biotin carboxyl carrier protein subunit [Paramuribaculum sp.]